MTKLKLAAVSQQALDILRSLTPSDTGHHPAPDYPHTHPVGPSKHKPYERTGRLAESWRVRRQGAIKTVSIINPVYYAIFVEYGWYSSLGTYVPGHFMVKRALPRIRKLFIQENRKRFHIFFKQRPISSGKPITVDYSEYGMGETQGDLFEEIGSLREHETSSK